MTVEDRLIRTIGTLVLQLCQAEARADAAEEAARIQPEPVPAAPSGDA